MAAARKVQIIGAGDIGRRVCEGLAQADDRRSIQLVGRDNDATLRATNLAHFASAQRGYTAHLSHAVADLRDIDRMAEQIAAFDPDVIFLAASFQSWWVITTLPKPAFEALYAANFGPWLPMHLVPVLKAMQAVRLAQSNAIVVNAAYPDAVHPVLDAVGLSPHIGIGNVANNVPGITRAAADWLGLDPLEVSTRLTAHHYVSHRLSRTGDSGGAEMNLWISHNDEQIISEADVPKVLAELPRRYRRTGGLAGQSMTAASALSVLEPLVDESNALVHAPGPLGLAGGYPVVLRDGQISLALPPTLSKQEALRINLSGQIEDGIREICDDGTVVFESRAMSVLTSELGYECPEMAIDEAEDYAEDLAERLAAYRQSAVWA